MRNLYRVPFWLCGTLGVLCFSGCGSSSTSASINAEIEGTWVSGCVADSGISYRTQFVFSGQNGVQTTSTYTDATCTTPYNVVVANIASIYIGLNTITTPADAKSIDAGVTGGTLTPATSAAVSAASAEYSPATFSIGVATDITSLGTTPINSILATIYKVSGTTLYLGDTSGSKTGRSTALRPTAFSSVTYTKQ